MVSTLQQFFFFNLFIQQACAHIMKKTPPQSAMHERLVGSTLDERPIGPRTRPRRLHRTTRRTTQQMHTHTLHLKKIQHKIKAYFFPPPLMFLNVLRLLPDKLCAFYLGEITADVTLRLVQSLGHIIQSRQLQIFGKLRNLRGYVTQLLFAV